MARNQQSSEPVGTPPEGGRWTWDGSAWVRVPEEDNSAASAANGE